MEYKSPYGKSNKDVIRLATNENPYNIESFLKDKLAEELEHTNIYPKPEDVELKEMIAKKHEILTENVVIGAGADEVISMLAFRYIMRGDNAIVSKHTFFRYKQLVKLAHGECKEIEELNFKHDLESFINNIDANTKMIFICNPDNPTGTFIGEKEIEGFISQIPSNIIIVLDEAYVEYVLPAQNESKKFLLQKYPNVIILRTFSKFYRLAGLRVGYGIGGKDIIRDLNEFRSPYSVGSLALRGAKLVLSNSLNTTYLEEVENERRKYYKFFKEKSLEFLKSNTNFIFASLGEDTEKICDKLKNKGIIIRSCNIFGYKNYVRITIGSPRENDKLIDELNKIMEGKDGE